MGLPLGKLVSLWEVGALGSVFSPQRDTTPKDNDNCWGTVSESALNIKNTMLTSVCSWRHVKEDYLHHFSLPHVNLLVWIMITKLAPRYYQKIDVILNNTGCFQELPSWRHNFKAAWKKAMKTPITMPLNERYHQQNPSENISAYKHLQSSQSSQSRCKLQALTASYRLITLRYGL